MKQILLPILIASLTACGGDGSDTEANNDMGSHAYIYETLHRFISGGSYDGVQPPLSSMYHNIVSIDVDNDGDLDVLIGRELWADKYTAPTYYNAFFLEYTPSGYEVTELDKPFNFRHAVVEDFNGDGFQDVYFASHGSENSNDYENKENIYWINNGNKTFTAVPLTDNGRDDNGSQNYTHSACAIDVNHDGYMDLYEGNYNYRNQIRVNDRSGNLEFEDWRLSQANLTLTSASLICTTGDFNNDGYDDLVIGMSGGDIRYWDNDQIRSHIILFGNGVELVYDEDRSVIHRTNYKLKPYVYNWTPERDEEEKPDDTFAIMALELQVGDLNDDGCLDLAAHNTDYTYHWSYEAYLGDCKGGFEKTYEFYFETPNPRYGDIWFSNLELLDVNDDGVLDMVGTREWIRGQSPSEIPVFIGEGDGKFDKVPMTRKIGYKLNPAQFAQIAWLDECFYDSETVGDYHSGVWLCFDESLDRWVTAEF